MHGVTVINQTEVVETNWVAIAVVLIVTLIVVMALSYVFKFDFAYMSIISVVVLVGVAVFAEMIPGVDFNTNTGRHQYEVYIDKDVPMMNVFSRYDIIEQTDRGTWILEDWE